jgi:UDP-glucose 4-epimerase
MELTVAVTGPTGEIGMSVVRALEQDDRVGRILGMARRPFDPVALGWRKTEYRRGDVLDRAVVDKLVADADVVVHLAFAILGSRDQTSDINLQGSRNVFEATVAAARPNRLVYTSSLAAYGYHADNPVPITEDVAARGSDQHYYSQQKAACENMLAEVTAFSPELEVYVLRPCIVAGPEATLLIRSLPWQQIAERLPGPVRRLLGGVPFVRPVLLDPGVPFQLVHHDDVAAAVRAAVLGAGEPGPYNLAADGEITMTDLAHALGDHAVPVPHELARLTARVVQVLPLLPAEAEWIHAVRHPMLMDTGKARRQLGWAPEYTARQTLTALAGAVR